MTCMTCTSSQGSRGGPIGTSLRGACAPYRVSTPSKRRQSTHRCSASSDSSSSYSSSASSSSPSSATVTVTTLPRPAIPIELIVTDVDGTLLNSSQELDESVLASIKNARAAGVPLMIATGKAVGPWTQRILPALESTCPEIFLQGLFIRDQHGNTLYSNTLADDVLRHCISLARKLGVALVLYSSDRIICETCDKHTDRLIFYGEPTPEAIGDVASYLDAPETALDIHKVIFMADDKRIQETVRPVVDVELAAYNVALTSAIEGMVEVLPPGASKGRGVEYVLRDVLGVDPRAVMALGDGENDVEMLELVGWGVAVGNAGAKAKVAADIVSEWSNDEGAVGKAIDEWVLGTS